MPHNQQKAKARPAEKCDLHPSIADSNDDVAKTQAKNKIDDDILAPKQRQSKDEDVAELDSESKTSDAETTNEPGMEMEVEEPEDNETADGISDDKSMRARSRIDTGVADEARIESHGDEVRCVFDSV